MSAKKPKKCETCGEPAAFFLTTLIGGEEQTLALCHAHAEELGPFDPHGYAYLDDGHTGEEGAPAAGPRCDHCGLTKAAFERTGRLGCPHCYESFGDVLHPFVRRMHRGTTHLGKVPRSAFDAKVAGNRIAHLTGEMKKAIASERYEDAAHFRDKIRALNHALREGVNFPASGSGSPAPGSTA